MSRTHLLLGCCLSLQACGEEPAPAPKAKPGPVNAAAPAPAAEAKQDAQDAPPPINAAPSQEAATGAAALVARYYEHIGQRRIEEAWRLRARGTSLERFRATYGRYGRSRATVGTPSLPVEAEGWIYVDVPVQIFGTMADGAPFATGGTVTVRRSASGGEWQIYSG